eukprot:GEMP01001971.1.p1 GENE.GEMP01001971.1~~GEMP01001971.1.p1  ORF type:complete len:722 (-),score=100.12 GEMP01001971.1:2907-4820(-)
MRQFQFKSKTPYDTKTGVPSFPLDLEKIPPKWMVKSIIPLDADFDGFLDLLVVYGDASNSRYLYHVLENKLKSSLWFKTPVIIQGEFVVEPLVADLNMDGIPDFLTQDSDNIQVVESKIDVDAHSRGINYQKPKNWEDSIFDVIDSTAHLRRPHGSAIIDIDGDCNLDIALVMAGDSNGDFIRFFSSYTRSVGSGDNITMEVRWRPLQVLEKDPYHQSLQPASLNLRIPSTAGYPVFIDANADGTIDILYPTFDSANNLEIHAIYNKQMPVCVSPLWRESGCKDSKDMCRVCPAGMCKDVKLASPVTVFSAKTNPIPFNVATDRKNVWLRTADYNNDMYPDLVVQNGSTVIILTTGEGQKSGDGSDAFYYSQPCISYDVADSDSKASKVIRSAFFDSGPTFGWIDLLIQTDKDMQVFTWAKHDKSEGHTYHLTTIGLNGICVPTPAHGCGATSSRTNEGEDDDTSERKRGYGQSYPGVTFKLALTNFQGHNIPRVGTQLSQQAYMALQEPYVHFGLAQSNNYVSELFTALTVPPYSSRKTNSSDNVYNRQNCPFYRHFVGSAIIPNTAIRVIPYRREYPQEWELVMDVSPANDIWMILLVSTCILGGLGALIMFNEYRDRKKQEKRQYRDFRIHFIK